MLDQPPKRLIAEVNRVDRMLTHRVFKLEERIVVAKQLEALWSDVVQKLNTIDTSTPGYEL